MPSHGHKSQVLCVHLAKETALVLQLCDGATPAERQAWQLGPAKEYHYLNQSSCYQLKDVDNAAEYKVCMGSCTLRRRGMSRRT